MAQTEEMQALILTLREFLNEARWAGKTSDDALVKLMMDFHLELLKAKNDTIAAYREWAFSMARNTENHARVPELGEDAVRPPEAP